MLINESKSKPDLFDQLLKTWRTLRLIFYDPIHEIVLGVKTKALPATFCWAVGILLSLMFFFFLDARIMAVVGKRSLGPGKIRDVLSITSVFWGFLFWAYYRVGLRMKRNRKLDHTFFNTHIETRLKERPQIISDLPLDESTRRLRLRGRGIPVRTYLNAKVDLESALNVDIVKIQNPENNREIVDIIYSLHPIPGFWKLDSLMGYHDFSFPVGKNYNGEIVATLKSIPHYLVAGESGGGKSSFIRIMLAVLLANNSELEVYHLDFKEGMENQVFQGFTNITLVDEVEDASAKMLRLNDILETRMKTFKNAKARSLEMYNKSQARKADRENRIVIVVDEISELIPTLGGKSNSSLKEINSVINRIARMGRAVGMNLVIGTQKPDAKNLDPTIKANLMGVVCFPVTHFSQSTVILGSSRAAELNAEIAGRAIWKTGSNVTEVQTPFLTEEEVNFARERAAKFWGNASKVKGEVQAPQTAPPEEGFTG